MHQVCCIFRKLKSNKIIQLSMLMITFGEDLIHFSYYAVIHVFFCKSVLKIIFSWSLRILINILLCDLQQIEVPRVSLKVIETSIL